MAGNGGAHVGRYWAFISYSHRDAAFARRLHRRLERYTLPRRLVGRETGYGTLPKRLSPIFRDLEELPASHDLSSDVRSAIQASQALIVVCSPAAAASSWVAREVELFRALHPDRPVLAALYSGDPNTAFPVPLRFLASEDGNAEPLAADFRRGLGDEHLGLLKLVVGMVGVGLDELVQRDARRRVRRVTAVTAAAVVALIGMGLLSAGFYLTKRDATHQRSKAEGLVDFMLTDLRTKLKGVGRLDIMTAVNARALEYYGDENLDVLTPDSLERRARVLLAMGEDDETRGEHDLALREFREARRTTEALLRIDPNNPDRIYGQAQSEYWIGAVDYGRGRYVAAKPGFLAYRRMAARLTQLAPQNSKYRLEVGEADNNLCALAVTGLTDPPDKAVHYCANALSETEAAVRGQPVTGDVAANLIDRHAWLADALLMQGEFAKARRERLAEESLITAQLQRDPKNADLKDSWIALQRAFAALAVREGNIDEARKRLMLALNAADEMVKLDPANEQWTKLHTVLLKEAGALDKTTERKSSP